jgi:PAS domain-containing protein
VPREPARVELSARTPAGLRRLDLRVTPLRDAGGRVLAALAVARDVTREREVEARARVSDAQVQTVFETVGALVWTWDFRSGAVWRRGTLLQRIGYAPDIGQGPDHDTAAWWIDQTHPDDRAVQAERARAIAAGEVARLQSEYRFRRADGSYATLASALRVLSDDAGQATRAVGIELDVSARVEAEHAHREIDARFRQIVEHMLEVFWLVELGPTPAEHRLLYLSPGWSRITRRPPAEVPGPLSAALGELPPDDAPRSSTRSPRPRRGSPAWSSTGSRRPTATSARCAAA